MEKTWDINTTTGSHKINNCCFTVRKLPASATFFFFSLFFRKFLRSRLLFLIWFFHCLVKPLKLSVSEPFPCSYNCETGVKHFKTSFHFLLWTQVLFSRNPTGYHLSFFFQLWIHYWNASNPLVDININIISNRKWYERVWKYTPLSSASA